MVLLPDAIDMVVGALEEEQANANEVFIIIFSQGYYYSEDKATKVFLIFLNSECFF